MLRIIKRREHETITTHYREFEHNSLGAGYHFQCDKDGNVLPGMNSTARENLRKCLNGEHRVIDRGIIEHQSSCHHPAIGECPCGDEVILSNFTNSCDCGRDYNMSGQELAPREQWGSETGESLADILMIP